MKKPPKFDPPGMHLIPAAEAFHQPQVVGGRIARHKHEEIEAGVAMIEETRAKTFIKNTLSKAKQSPSAEGADSADALEGLEAEREARSAVSSFLRAAGPVWLDALDAESQRDILDLVYRRSLGQIEQSPYAAAIRKAKATAVRPCVRDWSDTRPRYAEGDYSSSTRLPYGY